MIISNAAKKIEYNHGLAITLRLVFKILIGTRNNMKCPKKHVKADFVE